MNGQFELTPLTYRGRDADRGLVDLGQLGDSIQGASRLIGSAGNIVVTGQYVKKVPALAVRVMATPPVSGSYEIGAWLMTIAPAAAPMFPTIYDIGRKAATTAVEAIVNYAMAKLGGRDKESEMAFDVATTALKEMGQTSRTAVEAIERVATGLRPAARMFVAPIGESCDTAQIGTIEHGAIVIDRTARDAIEAPEPIEIGPAKEFEVLLSELDLHNKSCKLSLRDIDEPDRRIPGEITDPLVQLPGNPYAVAFAAQAWLRVKGKPQISDGDLAKLFISDVAE